MLIDLMIAIIWLHLSTSLTSCSPSPGHARRLITLSNHIHSQINSDRFADVPACKWSSTRRSLLNKVNQFNPSIHHPCHLCCHRSWVVWTSSELSQEAWTGCQSTAGPHMETYEQTCLPFIISVEPADTGAQQNSTLSKYTVMAQN